MGFRLAMHTFWSLAGFAHFWRNLLDFFATFAGSVLEIQGLPSGKSWKVSATPTNTGVLPIDASGLLPDVLKKDPF